MGSELIPVYTVQTVSPQVTISHPLGGRLPFPPGLQLIHGKNGNGKKATENWATEKWATEKWATGKKGNGNLGNHLGKMGNGKWGNRHPVKMATENWATNLLLTGSL